MDNAKTVLFVVDTQSLYYSARNIYGPGARINFKDLRQKFLDEDGVGFFTSVAYVANKEDNGDEVSLNKQGSFIEFLRKVGYDVNLFLGKNATQEMIDKIRDSLSEVDSVIVGTGTGELYEVLREVIDSGAEARVVAFSGSVHQNYEKDSDIQVEYVSPDLVINYANEERYDGGEKSRAVSE